MIASKKKSNVALAMKIATAIRDSGKTAKTIAAEVGVQPQAVTGWKTTGSIGKDTLVRFASVVGKHPLYFIENAEQNAEFGNEIEQLSLSAQKLIWEIIRAEKQGSSSPELIEALTKVLHVAIPSATTTDYAKLRNVGSK